MNKNNKIIASVVALFLLVAGGVGAYYVTSQNTSDKVQETQTVTVSKDITFSSDGKEVTYAGQDGQTALDVLSSLTDVGTKESAFGTMVTEIRGVKAEENASYWAFYVDDAYASEGAGTYKTKASETITWKLEAITQ